ncbi:MAG TPA: phage holin family protein [Gaiellaceae bacterium]|nr:phage holin family protein [Gaiellaceae bacterium]
MLGFRRNGSPSLFELVKEVAEDAVKLVRAEVELARARLAQTLKRTGIAVALLLGAAGLALLGGIGLLVTAGIALALVLPGWAAAVIVSGCLLVTAAVAARLGLAQLGRAKAARTSGPVAIETELQDRRYRLEAELEALSAKLDPRRRATASTNGHSH